MNNEQSKDSKAGPIEISNGQWWRSRRRKYNIGLIRAGVLAFVLYFLIIQVKSSVNVQNIDPERYEITLFTTFFQGVVYLIMMGIANIFYNLGPLIDGWLNPTDSLEFSNRLFNGGFWFSCTLPFVIPLLALIFA